MSTATTTLRRLERDTIVTGEAVELEIAPASPIQRIGSFVVDAFFALSCGLIFIMGISVLDPPFSNAGREAVLALVFAVVFVGVPVTVETLLRGRSLGKLLLRLMVVRDDGGAVRFRHILVRALVGVLELWATIGGIALLTAMLNKRGKRLGDFLAGTYVVALPNPRTRVPLVLPPELASWAATVQIMRIPPALTMGVRSHLETASRMRPELRITQARKLAHEMERYVTPPPPAGTDPERFLAATLTVRRDRDFANLVAQARREQAAEAAEAQLPFGIGAEIS